MIVNSLELNNYRNYNKLMIEFSKGTNILYGDNAQGKTNILEAIYLASTTKSHRGTRDRDMIQFGMEESHIRLHLLKEEIHHQIDMHLKKNKTKGVAIDQIPIRKSSDLFGFVPIIFFSPEDLSIIKDGPNERRKFLDTQLSQLEKLYLFHLSNYNKTLSQRNNLLKQISFQPSLESTLESWNEQLVKYGCEIIKFRKCFIEELNQIIYNIHYNLTGKREKIFLKYENSVDEASFLEELERKKYQDLKYCTTNIGPHRDDICFIVNDIDIRKFGSQGQKRTTALSLKLAQIQLVKKIMKETPILLLDDVLSELDTNRKTYLVDSIKDIQTIITCTGLEEFVHSDLRIDKTFRIKKGEIVEEN